MTKSGNEPATFRFVVQHLNHCATVAPDTNLYTGGDSAKGLAASSFKGEYQYTNLHGATNVVKATAVRLSVTLLLHSLLRAEILLTFVRHNLNSFAQSPCWHLFT